MNKKRTLETIYENDPLAIKYALQRGDLKQVKSLLELYGSKSDEIDYYEILCYAVHLEEIDLIEILISKAYIDISWNGFFLLCWASERGYTKLMDGIISNKNIPTAMITRAFGNACSNGHVPIVQRLLPFCKKINSGFVSACKSGHSNVVEYLLIAGVDPSFDQQLVLYTVAEQGHMHIFKLLLASPCIHLSLENHRFFRWLCTKGFTPFVQYLLDTGKVDITVERQEPIRFACHLGFTEIVQLLLSYGADPTVENNYCLRYAITRGHTHVVKILLDSGKVHPTQEHIDIAVQNWRRDIEVLLKTYITNMIYFQERIQQENSRP